MQKNGNLNLEEKRVSHQAPGGRIGEHAAGGHLANGPSVRRAETFLAEQRRRIDQGSEGGISLFASVGLKNRQCQGAGKRDF